MTGDPAPARRPARRLPRPGPATAGLLFVLLAVLACFPRVLSPRWVLFSRDIHAYWYPMVSTFVRVVAEGRLPLWDPFEAYGLPLWADPGQQVAYPPTWLNLLLMPHVVYKLLVVGHLFGGGAGVFALLRRFRLGVLPATAAGVAFACGGPLVSAGSLVHHLCGAAWIGWVLWAFEGVLERGGRRDVGLLALMLGMQALAGSAETCAMAALLVVLRWCTVAAHRWGAAVRRVAPLVAAAAVGALVMAIQWLPTLALLGRTSRMRFPPESKFFWSIHPATMLDAFVPRLVAEVSMGGAAREALYESREPFLMSLYFGIATLPLVLLALRSQRPQRLWAWLSFAFFLLLAFGRHVAATKLFLTLPLLSLFRYPAKYLWAAAFAWAVLVGLGVDVWWRAWNDRDRTVGRIVAGAMLALAVALALGAHRLTSHPEAMIRAFQIAEPWRAWMAILASRKLQAAGGWLAAAALLLVVRAWRPEWARVTAVAAIGLATADLSIAARPVNPLAPVELMLHRPPLLEYLLPDAQRLRVLSTGGIVARLNQELTRGPAGWEPEWRWTLGIQEMISAPLGSRWNLRGSYDADFTGLASPAQPFMAQLVVQTESTPLGVRLLQMGNVGWVIDPRTEGFPLLAETARSQSVFASPLHLYRVPDPLPPAYVVPSATRADTDESIVRRIASIDFDPRQEAVLAGPGEPLDPVRGFRGAAAYELRHGSLLRIRTETNAAAVLVVSEAFDPDWRATVDGAPAAIERANVLFRGVRVPAGRHLVEMAYAPRTIPWAIGATLVGLLVIAVLVRPVRPA